MSDPNRYPAHVFWSDEDEGFIAVAPDLPGCSAFGDTQPEALAELQVAIEAWIEAARAAKNSIPKPSNPALQSQYSGKVLVRMPRALHARLIDAAKAEDVSLNQYIVYLLSTASAHVVDPKYHSHRALYQSLQFGGASYTYRAVFGSFLLIRPGREQEVKSIHIDVGNELTAITTGQLRLEEQYG